MLWFCEFNALFTKHRLIIHYYSLCKGFLSNRDCRAYNVIFGYVREKRVKSFIVRKHAVRVVNFAWTLHREHWHTDDAVLNIPR